jgi:hypothetical protein
MASGQLQAPRTHWTEGLSVVGTGMVTEEKRKILPSRESSMFVQPVVRHYTD